MPICEQGARHLFNHETLRILQEGASAAAVLNVVTTTCARFAAGWLGLAAGKYFTG